MDFLLDVEFLEGCVHVLRLIDRLQDEFDEIEEGWQLIKHINHLDLLWLRVCLNRELEIHPTLILHNRSPSNVQIQLLPVLGIVDDVHEQDNVLLGDEAGVDLLWAHIILHLRGDHEFTIDGVLCEGSDSWDTFV